MAGEGVTRRGRTPRAEPAKPTGYRATAYRRVGLALTQAFLDEPSLQAVIDQAVDEYLAKRQQEIPGLGDAIAASAAHRDRVKNNVRTLRPGANGDAG